MKSTGPEYAQDQFKAGYQDRFGGFLAGCEERLTRISHGPGGRLGEACALTLAAGGKRLRPLLVFLTTKKGYEVDERIYAAAVAVELVHMASLVHDDILDGAQLRRGQPTLAARYGPLIGAAAGDYLFASAFKTLAAQGVPRAVSMLASASLGLSRGEFAQMEQARDHRLPLEAYLVRCGLKTAGLFSAACSLGSLLSGCREQTISAMSGFGRSVGMAFQITDDILDFAGESAELGKQAGADLRDGTVTMPLMIGLERDTSLAGLLGVEPRDPVVAEICRRVRDTGALDDAAKETARHVAQAQDAARAAADEIDAEPLILIAEMAAERKK